MRLQRCRRLKWRLRCGHQCRGLWKTNVLQGPQGPQTSEKFPWCKGMSLSLGLIVGWMRRRPPFDLFPHTSVFTYKCIENSRIICIFIAHNRKQCCNECCNVTCCDECMCCTQHMIVIVIIVIKKTYERVFILFVHKCIYSFIFLSLCAYIHVSVAYQHLFF